MRNGSVVNPSLVYVCDWLPPDFGAVGQYAIQFARERAAEGDRVALYGLSSSDRSVQLERFGPGTLKIVRLKAAVYDRTSFRKRAWWTLRTNLALISAAFRDMRTCREILFTGSPPFLVHFLAPLNLFLRKILIYRITDFFPECLMAEYPRVPAALRMLYWLTLFWRRRVTQFEVLGEDQRARLLEVGMPAKKILLRRCPSPVRIDRNTEPLERPTALQDRRILLYSGNFGVAHDHATFLAAYRKHHRDGSGRVAIWLNATGRRADDLQKALEEENLPFLRTKPLPIERLASLLVTPDAHLITLLDRFAGFVLPSKVHACIESQKPIVYIGPKTSDVHLLCSTLTAPGCYHQLPVGDVEGLIRVLETI
jgi:hypothetical protein